MDDFTYSRSPMPDAPDAPDTATPAAEAPAAAAGTPAESAPAPGAANTPALSPAVEKFRSCRWRAAPDLGEYCTHRDVLPFAGKEGFNPESWCPECAFYKLRRTPKKRERVDYTY